MRKITLRDLEKRVNLGDYHTTQRITFKGTMAPLPGRGTLHRDANGYPVSASESNVIKRGIAEKTFHFSTFSIIFKEAFEKGYGEVHHFYINTDAVEFDYGEQPTIIDGIFVYDDDLYDEDDEEAQELKSRSYLSHIFTHKLTAIDYSGI